MILAVLFFLVAIVALVAFGISTVRLARTAAAPGQTPELRRRRTQYLVAVIGSALVALLAFLGVRWANNWRARNRIARR